MFAGVSERSDGSGRGRGCLACFMALYICSCPIFLGDLCIVTNLRAYPKLYMNYCWYVLMLAASHVYLFCSFGGILTSLL